MGVSASASVFIGFIVDHSDFWSETTQTSKQPECPKGHPGVDGKFCQDCGGKIAIQKRTVNLPTSRFKAFVDEYNKTATYKLSYEEVWDPNLQHPDEQCDTSPFGGLELECVDAKDHSENDNQSLAFGETILSVHNICGGSIDGINAITLDEIKAKMIEVEKLRNVLGIDRPVQVFLTSYCSY